MSLVTRVFPLPFHILCHSFSFVPLSLKGWIVWGRERSVGGVCVDGLDPASPSVRLVIWLRALGEDRKEKEPRPLEPSCHLYFISGQGRSGPGVPFLFLSFHCLRPCYLRGGRNARK